MLSGFLLAASLVTDLLTGSPREVELPSGVVAVDAEIHVPAGFRVRGSRNGTVLRASSKFRGRAVLICESGVTVSGLTIEGNRREPDTPEDLAPYDRSFISFYSRNGIVADGVHDLTLRDLTIRGVAGFAVIISASEKITLDRIQISASGSLKANGRNNTSGGILLEEGTRNFSVRGCRLTDIRGNGIWTHSRYTSPRNGPGAITGNHFENIGRDALQAGHATELTIEGNTGRKIGWPVGIIDVEGGGTPVAIDTAGNVDKSVYAANRFAEINGKCIDLDGFHDGDVRDNVCINRGKAEDYPFGHYGIVFNNSNPDMQSSGIRVTGNMIDGARFGGIFVIGSGHTIRGNRLLRLNLARCGCPYDPKQPELLGSGIYLGAGAERPDPARGNRIIGNTITGYQMKQHCIAAAPGVDLKAQTITRNQCSNAGPQ